ncbi:MAG: ribbon-helix-helix domain-containing protein [Syntrophobacteraceae bacterium]
MKTISIKLPDDLLAKIQYAAKKRGETRSAFIRESVEEFLSKEENQSTVPASTLRAILQDVCKARRTFRQIRHTAITTGDETSGHPGDTCYLRAQSYRWMNSREC